SSFGRTGLAYKIASASANTVQDYSAEKPLLQSKPPSSSFLTGRTCFLSPSMDGAACHFLSIHYKVRIVRLCALLCIPAHSTWRRCGEAKGLALPGDGEAVTILDQGQESEDGSAGR